MMGVFFGALFIHSFITALISHDEDIRLRRARFGRVFIYLFIVTGDDRSFVRLIHRGCRDSRPGDGGGR